MERTDYVPPFDWRTISPKDRYKSEAVPDRLSVEPSSEWHCPIFMRRISVKIDGVIAPRVIEYCVSEGWIRQHRVPSGKIRVSKNGSVVAFKKKGRVKVELVGPLMGQLSEDGQHIEVKLVRGDGATFDAGRIDLSDVVHTGGDET
jgi:hypothetical protein